MRPTDDTSVLDGDGVNHQILRLTAAGTSPAIIARNLNLSERTVRRRVDDMRSRLGVATTVELVVHAVRAGWI